ncbi:MAG: pyridoxal-phosphate dependent enzyme, partial [Candidatus Hydrogenedentota bacterium]
GICGAMTVFRALKPDVEIIGVQAANASCVYESWKQGKAVTTQSADTFADGLATRIPMELPLAMIPDGVDDIITVTEEELRQAVKLAMTTTHNLVEGAGAASTAGAIAMKDRLKGKTVAAVLSGGNIDAETLRWVMGE